MEWIPKLLDNLDSAAFALYQSWGGYHRWVFLRFALTVIAVSAMIFSPVIRALAIGIVTTYVAMEAIAWSVSRFRPSRIVRARS